MTEEQEKAKLIKEALKIVDAMSDLNIYDYEDLEILEKLIKKSKDLKTSKHWKLS